MPRLRPQHPFRLQHHGDHDVPGLLGLRAHLMGRDMCATCHAHGVTGDGATCPACHGTGQDTP